MKKLKLFSLALMALFATNLWADTYADVYTNPASGSSLAGNANGKGAFSVITPAGGVSFGNSALQIGSNGGSGTFTIASIDGSYITSISFTSQSNYPINTLTSEDGNIVKDGNVYTFTPSSATLTSASFSMSAQSSKKVRVAPITVNLTSDHAYLSMNFGVSSGTVSCTKSSGASDLVITTTGSASSNRLSFGSGKSLTFTSAGHDIASIHFTFVNHAEGANITANTGTFSGSSWTPTTSVQSVTFSSSSSNTIGAISVKLEEHINYYTLSFDANGHGTAPDPIENIESGTKPAKPEDPSEEGWIFGGWNNKADGTGEDWVWGTSAVTQDTTLYAKWTEDPSVVKYHVTYDLNGASGDAPTQDDAAAGVEITLADEPSWEHHTFDGWLCNIDSKVKAAGSAYTMTAANTTFTAQWTELFAITEGTPANGSVDADLAEAEESTTITLTATPATDYLFDAWDVYKTGDESTKVTVTDNQFTMPAYAVTVSASFIADTRKKILYLTTASTASDKMYAALKDNYNVKVEAPASQTLTNYDLIVLHESLKGSDAGSGILKSVATAAVPVLNTKSYFYSDGRWGWGTPNAGKSVNGATLNNEYTNITSHPIFEGVTISEGFVTLFSEAKAKAMQPIGSFTEGKEGYTLATTPNASSGNGCAIHELTPAQRGVASGKYLMISIGNENACFGVLTENGQKLLQNAAAYLLSNEAWVPSTTPTALNNTEDELKAVKYFKDGQIFIEKNGHVYNVFGACVK